MLEEESDKALKFMETKGEELKAKVLEALRASGAEVKIVQPRRTGGYRSPGYTYFDDVEVDGTRLESHTYYNFHAEEDGSRWNQQPTGKLRVVLPQTFKRYARQNYPEPKGGHKPEVIAERILKVLQAEQQRDKEDEAQAQRQKQAEKDAASINALFGLIPFRSRVYVNNVGSTLTVKLPNEHLSFEDATRLVKALIAGGFER